jgi:hypothetical protein
MGFFIREDGETKNHLVSSAPWLGTPRTKWSQRQSHRLLNVGVSSNFHVWFILISRGHQRPTKLMIFGVSVLNSLLDFFEPPIIMGIWLTRHGKMVFSKNCHFPWQSYGTFQHPYMILYENIGRSSTNRGDSPINQVGLTFDRGTWMNSCVNTVSSMSFGLIFRRDHVQKWIKLQGNCGAKLKKTKEHLSRCPPFFCLFFFNSSMFVNYCFLFFHYLIDLSLFFISFSFARQLKENTSGYPKKTFFQSCFTIFCYVQLFFPRFRLFLCICHNLVFFILVLNHHLLYLCTIF